MNKRKIERYAVRANRARGETNGGRGEERK